MDAILSLAFALFVVMVFWDDVVLIGRGLVEFFIHLGS